MSHQIVVKPPAAIAAALISLAEDVLTVASPHPPFSTIKEALAAYILDICCSSKKEAEYWLQQQLQHNVRAKLNSAKCQMEASTLNICHGFSSARLNILESVLCGRAFKSEVDKLRRETNVPFSRLPGDAPTLTGCWSEGVVGC